MLQKMFLGANTIVFMKIRAFQKLPTFAFFV